MAKETQPKEEQKETKKLTFAQQLKKNTGITLKPQLHFTKVEEEEVEDKE